MKDQILKEFDAFCKRRRWHPTIMGVEFDHYKSFLLHAIEEAEQRCYNDGYEDATKGNPSKY